MFLNDHANLGFFSGWHCHILGFIYFAPFFITTGLNFGESLASHWGSALLEDEGWGAAWAVGKWWEGSLSNISWKTAQLAKMGHWKLEIGLSRYQPSAFQLQYPSVSRVAEIGVCSWSDHCSSSSWRCLSFTNTAAPSTDIYVPTVWSCIYNLKHERLAVWVGVQSW